MVDRAFSRRNLSIWLIALLALVLPFTGPGVAHSASQGTATADAPTGVYLTPEELQAITAQFTDDVLTGGQVPPRISRWVNENVFMFLQLDNADPAQATAIRYIGIGVKGVFCAETQPDPSFTHFHKYDAPEYSEGHGSQPGDQGYWLTWAATETFDTRDGRHVTPGIDYEFSPTPPPDCGSTIPEANFTPEGADALTSEEIVELMTLFNDGILTGGQVPPRFHKWVNKDVSIFLQFDSSNPAEATVLRNVGITVPGTFCASSQPSEDFPHFHQTHAPAYGEGHGSAPGQVGYWLLWIATESYETRDGRQVEPGVDREFSPTPPPECEDSPDATPVSNTQLSVTGSEYRFEPSAIHVQAGESVTVTFTNAGKIPHTLTIPFVQADTGSVAAGAAATLTFSTPAEAGEYEFLCSFGGHLEAGMAGTLIVD
jgi:plastocyanin